MKQKLSTYIVIALAVVVAVVGVFSLHKTTAVAQQAITSLADLHLPVHFPNTVVVQVSPWDDSFLSFDSFLQGWSNLKFRVHGDSVLNDTLIAENLDIDIPVSSIGYATANLNIGYLSTSVPSLARMQVDGDVKVYGLNTGNSDPYCVCADQYGVMKTCGRYDPANGLTCTTTPPNYTCTGTWTVTTNLNMVKYSIPQSTCEIPPSSGYGGSWGFLATGGSIGNLDMQIPVYSVIPDKRGICYQHTTESSCNLATDTISTATVPYQNFGCTSTTQTVQPCIWINNSCNVKSTYPTEQVGLGTCSGNITGSRCKAKLLVSPNSPCEINTSQSSCLAVSGMDLLNSPIPACEWVSNTQCNPTDIFGTTTPCASKQSSQTACTSTTYNNFGTESNCNWNTCSQMSNDDDPLSNTATLCTSNGCSWTPSQPIGPVSTTYDCSTTNPTNATACTQQNSACSWVQQ